MGAGRRSGEPGRWIEDLVVIAVPRADIADEVPKRVAVTQKPARGLRRAVAVRLSAPLAAVSIAPQRGPILPGFANPTRLRERDPLGPKRLRD